MGSMADSTYEYMLKQWLLSNKTQEVSDGCEWDRDLPLRCGTHPKLGGTDRQPTCGLDYKLRPASVPLPQVPLQLYRDAVAGMRK